MNLHFSNAFTTEKFHRKLCFALHKTSAHHIYSKKNLRDQWPPQDEIDSMTGKSSFVVLSFICILYFCCGAFMYKTWEDDWTYLDAVYFIFVSTRYKYFKYLLLSIWANKTNMYCRFIQTWYNPDGNVTHMAAKYFSSTGCIN